MVALMQIMLLEIFFFGIKKYNWIYFKNYDLLECLKMNKQIYLSFHNRLFDYYNKKEKSWNNSNNTARIKQFRIRDCLDIGTTPDDKNKSSNFIVKNLKKILNINHIVIVK